MSTSRLYQAVPLAIKSTLRLDEKASHHLARVLRAQVGNHLILFNGTGGEYAAVITRLDKKGVDVTITAFNDREAESPLHLCLAQGLARGEKMDFIIQKAVELGVQSIVPLVTERCNVRLDSEREEKRLQHWQSIAASACEQCGRNRLPDIMSPISLKDWLPQAKADLCFVLSPHVENKLADEKAVTPRSISLLIGPEGGLSDKEIKAAIDHGFLPLNLGPRVLRTETAPMAAIAILQHYYGDL